MDLKDYDFFAWMESERIPKSPDISKDTLSWWYVIPIMAFIIIFFYGLFT